MSSWFFIWAKIYLCFNNKYEMNVFSVKFPFYSSFQKLQHCQIFLSYCLTILMSPLVLKGLLGSVPESPHDAFRESVSKLKTIFIILITTTTIWYYFLYYHFLIVQKQWCVKVLAPWHKSKEWLQTMLEVIVCFTATTCNKNK